MVMMMTVMTKRMMLVVMVGDDGDDGVGDGILSLVGGVPLGMYGIWCSGIEYTYLGMLRHG